MTSDQTVRGPAPAANPEGGSSLPRIPRRWRDDAIRVCLDLGYTVSGDQAWRLLRDWQRWRRADVERFMAGEFGQYVQQRARRGDLIVTRTRRRHDWRVRT